MKYLPILLLFILALSCSRITMALPAPYDGDITSPNGEFDDEDLNGPMPPFTFWNEREEALSEQRDRCANWRFLKDTLTIRPRVQSLWENPSCLHDVYNQQECMRLMDERIKNLEVEHQREEQNRMMLEQMEQFYGECE